MTSGSSMRYSIDEALSGMLATIEQSEFTDSPEELATAFERLAGEFPLFAPMAAGVNAEAVQIALGKMVQKSILQHAEGKYVLTTEGRNACVSSKRMLFNAGAITQLEAAARSFLVGP
jgi:hypothetical protein